MLRQHTSIVEYVNIWRFCVLCRNESIEWPPACEIFSLEHEYVSRGERYKHSLNVCEQHWNGQFGLITSIYVDMHKWEMIRTCKTSDPALTQCSSCELCPGINNVRSSLTCRSESTHKIGLFKVTPNGHGHREPFKWARPYYKSVEWINFSRNYMQSWINDHISK